MVGGGCNRPGTQDEGQLFPAFLGTWGGGRDHETQSAPTPAPPGDGTNGARMSAGQGCSSLHPRRGLSWGGSSLQIVEAAAMKLLQMRTEGRRRPNLQDSHPDVRFPQSLPRSLFWVQKAQRELCLETPFPCHPQSCLCVLLEETTPSSPAGWPVVPRTGCEGRGQVLE